MEQGLILLGTEPILSNPYAELHMQSAEMGLLNNQKNSSRKHINYRIFI